MNSIVDLGIGLKSLDCEGEFVWPANTTKTEKLSIIPKFKVDNKYYTVCNISPSPYTVTVKINSVTRAIFTSIFYKDTEYQATTITFKGCELATFENYWADHFTQFQIALRHQKPHLIASLLSPGFTADTFEVVLTVKKDANV